MLLHTSAKRPRGVLYVLCLAAALSVSLVPAATATAAGEQLIGDTYYGVVEYTPEVDVTTTNKWQLCEARAELWGGHLVTIDGDPLNGSLASTFSGYADLGYLWIGLHNSIVYGEESNLSNWYWSSTGTNAPTYRNFASGYPAFGRDADSMDYAKMRVSDGLWEDDYPLHSRSPDRGIYELTRGNAVSLTMDVPLHAWGQTSDESAHDNATNAVAALLEDVENEITVTASAKAEAAGGSWGGRLESLLAVDNDFMHPDGPPSAGTETDALGSLILGTAATLPADAPVTLMVDPNMVGTGTWDFTLKRDGTTLLSLTTGDVDPHAVDCFAGETLTVEFTHDLAPSNDANSGLALNLWTVPEPASMALLAVGAAALIGRRRR
jgi:hypothetical protein